MGIVSRLKEHKGPQNTLSSINAGLSNIEMLNILCSMLNAQLNEH
jgi:hypothetical protein